MTMSGEASSTTFAILVVHVLLYRDFQVTLVMIADLVYILWLKIII